MTVSETAGSGHKRSLAHTRDDVGELAERYEFVAALDPIGDRETVRATLGPRVPPGAQEILDADEIAVALAHVESWATYLARVLVDELDLSVPDGTPARLRLVALHVEMFVGGDLLGLAFADELAAELRTMRRLARRSQRQIRTGIACQIPTCHGRYTAPVGGPDRHDDQLECDRCHHRVPYSVWSTWPRARITYVTVEHAARITGTTVAAVKQRASRGHWRRVGTGRDVRYLIDDVRQSTA